MSQWIAAGTVANEKRRARWEKRRKSVAKERRPRSYADPWIDAYRMPMGDGRGETWGTYLRRMTERPGWSVARLARESGVARQTIFAYISGKKTGVTVATVRAIGQALDDEPAALRAAGQLGPEVESDEELELVRTDDRLKPATKLAIIDLILERRERERVTNMAETRRIIEMMSRQDEAG
jgi:transcriptional regulator with XRE-family HTH domain